MQIEDSKGEVFGEVDSFRSWMVAFGSFLTHFIAIGVLYSYSIFVTTYEKELDATRAQVSSAYTFGLGVYFLVGIVAGRLSDKYGIHRIFFTGVIIWVAGLILASLSESLIVTIFTHGILVTGVGSSLVYFPAVTVVPQWFEKHRALGLGLAVLGAGLGNLSVGILGEKLIREYGWRVTLRILGGVGGGLLLIGGFLLKRRLPRETKGGIFSDVSSLKNRNYRLLLTSTFLFQFGYLVPFVHLAPYAEDLEYGTEFGALAAAMIGAGSASGRLILGVVADRVGRLQTFRIIMLLCGIIVCLWEISVTKAWIICFALLYGFFSGGFIAMTPVIVSEIFGPERLGGVYGLLSLSIMPGGLAGAPLAGIAYDLTDSYTLAIYVSGAIIIISCATLFFMRDLAGTVEPTLDNDIEENKDEQIEENKIDNDME